MKKQTTTTSREVKNFQYYATTAKANCSPASATECRQAFANGYIASLHKHQIYSTILFLEEKQALNAIRDIFSTFSITLQSVDPKLYYACNNILYNSSTVHSEKEAFICGYLLGTHKSGKYSDCLFLEGHQQEACIFSDLISCEIKQENARRAQARIIMQRFGTDKEQFRQMCEDTPPIE